MSVLVILALVITVAAVRFDGLASADVSVNSGGVWVLKRDGQLAGRLNVDAQEFDGRLSIDGDDLGILQDGYDVMATTARGIIPIDSATMQRTGTVDVGADPQIDLGSDRVGILGAGSGVWVADAIRIAGFSTGAQKPVLTADEDATEIAVTDSGTVFVLSGTDLYRIPRALDAAASTAERVGTFEDLSTTGDSVQLTTVGETPVVLDTEHRFLRIGEDDEERVSLDELGASVTSARRSRIQQPGTASDDVVLATSDTLYEVPLSGAVGRAESHPAEGNGDPVAPAQVDGCAYGAWNVSKRYVRACGKDVRAETIPDAQSDGDLALRVNGDLVVLNDQESGLSWLISEDMTLVDDWAVTQDIAENSAPEGAQDETSGTTVRSGSCFGVDGPPCFRDLTGDLT